MGGPEGGTEIRLNITTIETTVPVNCSFGHLGEFPPASRTANSINCTAPAWVPLNEGDPDSFGDVEVELRRNGTVFVPDGQQLIYGIPPPEDVEITSTKDESSLFATIGSTSTVGLIITLVAIFAFIRYRKKLAADKFRSLFDIPIFSLESAFSYVYIYDRSTESWFKKHSDQLWYLEEMLADPSYVFVDSLTTTFETHESDNLSKALVYIAETNGEAVNLLKHYMDLEFQSAPNGVQLFRGYNIASKMWTGYLKLDFGLEFIHTALARTLYQVCSELAYGDAVELHPDRAAEVDQSVSVNKYRVLGATQTIFESILNSVDIAPANLRYVLHYVKKNCQQKFSDYVHRSVGNFVFLRLFCPAIAAPEVYGLLKEEPEDQARHLL